MLPLDRLSPAAEKAVQDAKIVTLTAENDILRMKLEHKEELLALHNYYNKINRG